MITEKERLAAILEHNNSGRPLCFCPGGMMNMIVTELMQQAGAEWPQAHTDAKAMSRLAAASYETGCFENIGVPFCMTVEAEAMGAKVTLGTKQFEPHIERYVIDSVSQWRQLPCADFHTGRGKVALEALIELKKKYPHVPIVGNLTGHISTAASLMEPTVFYKELRKKKEDAHNFLRFVTKQLISFANLQIEAGADVIAISDPSGTGEILGPDLFETFTVSYLNELIEHLLPQKMAVIVHICGQMKSVYKQVNEIKADILSFDSIVPMKEARINLPDRILMGNVSTYALEFAEPEKIRTITRHCAEAGSDILAPACGLGTKTPLVNIQSMMEELKGFE